MCTRLYMIFPPRPSLPLYPGLLFSTLLTSSSHSGLLTSPGTTWAHCYIRNFALAVSSLESQYHRCLHGPLPQLPHVFTQMLLSLCNRMKYTHRKTHVWACLPARAAVSADSVWSLAESRLAARNRSLHPGGRVFLCSVMGLWRRDEITPGVNPENSSPTEPWVLKAFCLTTGSHGFVCG